MSTCIVFSLWTAPVAAQTPTCSKTPFFVENPGPIEKGYFAGDMSINGDGDMAIVGELFGDPDTLIWCIITTSECIEDAIEAKNWCLEKCDDVYGDGGPEDQMYLVNCKLCCLAKFTDDKEDG